MTNLEGDGNGVARVKLRKRRYWGLMLGFAAIMLGLSAIARILFWPDGPWNGDILDPQFAIWTSPVLLLLVSATMIIYHRIIDEQEERALLWGNTAGFYTLFFGGAIWSMFAAAKLVTPESVFLVWLVSGIFAIAVQLWRQYR
jgi:hypothetical protein